MTETQTDPRLKRDDPDFPRIASGTTPPSNNSGDGGGRGPNGCSSLIIFVTFIILCILYVFKLGIFKPNGI